MVEAKIPIDTTLQIINVTAREGISLNGVWNYVVDPYQTGYFDYRQSVRDQQANPSTAESLFLNHKPQNSSDRVEYDFEKSDRIVVPRDWNSQKEKLFYYEGSVWYYKKFNYQPRNKTTRQFICFEAVNYEADVYLNGQKLGKHIGGFTPFNFEVTGKLNDADNVIILKVDNTRGLEKVPTINTDWWNYGGITRDVMLIDVDSTFIQHYSIQLNTNNASLIEATIQLNGAQKSGQIVTVQVPEAGISFQLTTDDKGVAKTEFTATNLQLWTPETPKLYRVTITCNETNCNDLIGFRTIKTRGTDLLLNGRSVFLRGISIHEENGIRGGRAYSREDAQMLLGWAKELGCNFVRLAHYPHNENMTRVADEMGLMVWSEVPVYWTIQWCNEETFQNANRQLTDMIVRDRNRASVIIWSMANETPVSDERTTFLKRMIDTTRQLDGSRLISAALERHTKEGAEDVQVIDDPLQQYVDVVAFNEYIGWYVGKIDKCSMTTFEINIDKPVLVTEFGGDALQGLHGTCNDIWTEEYQEYLYRETLAMLEKIPQLRGITPWILADFRSPRRVLPTIQDGWNRKGLISETGNKKKAFYILRDYYSEKEIKYLTI
jgi:beta-glucuronidase